jgi:hypothetical protein
MFRTSQIYRSAFAFAVLFAAAITVNSSFAQSPEDYRNTPPGPFHQPVAPYPVEFGFSQDHSSTAAEGFLRGKAAVIQSLGNFQLSKSQADILREQARWLDRENDLKQSEALVAQKKIWSDARTQAEAVKKLRLAEGRQALAERKATVLRQKYHLTANQLDPATGAIVWPAFMQTEQFQEMRAELEQLVREHVQFANTQATSADDISHVVELWSQALNRGRASLPREEYLVAQKFLSGIKYTTAALERDAAIAGSVAPQAVPGATLANQ